MSGDKLRNIYALKDEYKKICKSAKLSWADFAEALGKKGIVLIELTVAIFAFLIVLIAKDTADYKGDSLKCATLLIGAILICEILIILISSYEKMNNRKLQNLWHQSAERRKNACMQLIGKWGITNREQLKELIAALKYVKEKEKAPYFSGGTLAGVLLATGISITTLIVECFLYRNEEQLVIDIIEIGLILTITVAASVVLITPSIKMLLNRENKKLDNFVVMLYDILNFEEKYK